MPQRIKFTLTTTGSDGSAIAQSDTYLVNGYLIGIGYTPGNGQATTLDLIARDDAGVLLTKSDIAAAGYDPDGSESKTMTERPIVGALVVQATGGNNNKTVDVIVDVAAESMI